YRLLSSAVSSDFGERSVVGPRFHGVDQRDQGKTTLSIALSTPSSGRPCLLRSSLTRSSDRPGRACRCTRDRGLLLLALLVQLQKVAQASLGESLGLRRAQAAVLPSLGQRVVV